MKEIVILTHPYESHTQEVNMMIACLGFLFPECDIRVVSQGPEISNLQTGSRSAQTARRTRK